MTLAEELHRNKHREAVKKSKEKKMRMRDELTKWMKHYNGHLPGSAVYEFYAIINTYPGKRIYPGKE